MIHPQIYALPAVQKALAVADKSIALATRAKAIGIQAYELATSDRAMSIYKTIRNAAVTTVLLSIASILLVIDGIKAIHRWAQDHSEWQYQDFEKVAADKVQAVATVVKVWVKAQRDRASLLVRSTRKTIELQARVKVAEVAFMVSDRALPSCKDGLCSVNPDEV